MITVFTSSYPHEAHLVKARLEQSGIPAFVFDDQIVSTNWVLGQAVGGVKVKVADDDYELAMQVLKEDVSSEEIVQRRCPYCDSTKIFRVNSAVFLPLAFLCFLLPFLFMRKPWRCEECGGKW